MRNRKYFWAGTVIFYVWYVYTCTVFQFADWYASGMLYRVLVAMAPLTWLRGRKCMFDCLGADSIFRGNRHFCSAS